MPSDKVAMQRTFFKNSIYGLLSWLLPIVPAFLATRIVVHRLGDEQYGVLVALIGFISYFFTTAVGKIAGKYVAEYTSNGEKAKISPVISATLIFGFVTTVAGLLITVAFARSIVADVLSIGSALQNEAIAGIYIASATVLVIVIAQVFQLVLQGLHRFDRFLLLANLSSVSFSLGSIVLALLGYGIVPILWWNLGTWLIVLLASYLAAKRALPEFWFTLRIDSAMFRIVASYGFGLIAYQLFGNVLLLFERGWIFRQFGAAELTFYVIPMSLAMYIHMFVASLVLAMFPKVNELLDRPEQLARLYKRATKVVVALVFFALACSVGGGYALIKWWLGESYANASYVLLIVHTITFAILGIHTVAWQIAESFRSSRTNAVATFAWMLVGITLMIPLSGALSSTGVAIGRLAGVVAFVAALVYTEHSFLGGFFARFWAATLSRTLVAGTVSAAIQLAILWLTANSLLGLIVAVIAGGINYFGFLMLTGYLDEDEKRILRETLAKKTQARA